MRGPRIEKKRPLSGETLQGPKSQKRAQLTQSQLGDAAESQRQVKSCADEKKGERGSRSDPAPLPCLNRNKCISSPLSDRIRELSTAHRKTAFALAKNVAGLCGKYGIERIGFLTLTFADHVTCAREAGKRFCSLRTNVLAHRYEESICVLERMKSGRIHFHLLVVLPFDIRTEFDFTAAENGVYTSANSKLRGEWAFWRSTARNYGFGRTELLPVKSNEEGLSKYVGKYIAKHIGSRENRDRGVHLVRYSSGAKCAWVNFAFASVRGKLWRWQVGEFARRHGCSDLAALALKFGKRWAYYCRIDIMNTEPPKDSEIWKIWVMDRYAIAAEVSEEIACTIGQAMTAVSDRWASRGPLEFIVPRWSGVKLAVRFDDDYETLVVWK